MEEAEGFNESRVPTTRRSLLNRGCVNRGCVGQSDGDRPAAVLRRATAAAADAVLNVLGLPPGLRTQARCTSTQSLDVDTSAHRVPRSNRMQSHLCLFHSDDASDESLVH